MRTCVRFVEIGIDGKELLGKPRKGYRVITVDGPPVPLSPYPLFRQESL